MADRDDVAGIRRGELEAERLVARSSARCLLGLILPLECDLLRGRELAQQATLNPGRAAGTASRRRLGTKRPAAGRDA
jgi:hypothetical protein